ncbi:MAG: hypothetical protein HRU20_15005 [Pseudomonadales bacterium]|nr:hypothetical protein [Pseudomonadales bacterium]
MSWRFVIAAEDHAFFVLIQLVDNRIVPVFLAQAITPIIKRTNLNNQRASLIELPASIEQPKITPYGFPWLCPLYRIFKKLATSKRPINKKQEDKHA